MLTLDFDYFVISLNRAPHFKEIKIVYKWPRKYSRLKFFCTLSTKI